MKAVRFDKCARQELDQAADYYESQSLGLGSRFIDRVSEAVRIISAYPSLFVMANRPYRCKLVRGFPYALYYREKDDTVIVLAVAHTSRKPGYWPGEIVRADVSAQANGILLKMKRMPLCVLSV